MPLYHSHVPMINPFTLSIHFAVPGTGDFPSSLVAQDLQDDVEVVNAQVFVERERLGAELIQGFTLIEAIGGWKGGTEQSYVFQSIVEGEYLNHVDVLWVGGLLAKRVAEAYGQAAVLVKVDRATAADMHLFGRAI